VRGGAEMTAIAGLSTGGAKAFLIGLNHLDRFSQIGMFSAGWFPQDVMKVEEEQRRLLDDPSLPKRLKLLWLVWGPKTRAPHSRIRRMCWRCCGGTASSTSTARLMATTAGSTGVGI
jgi:enterochelin esterase-like enzyme